MTRLMTMAAAAVLVLHGLIHLMGTTAYLRLAEIKGLPYKTAVLGGRWDLGEAGIQVYGALWLLPAAGFLLAATGLAAGAAWWPAAAITSAAVSLALTALDWDVAFMGGLVSGAILIAVAVWLAGRS
jgi:hypothetical protein